MQKSFSKRTGIFFIVKKAPDKKDSDDINMMIQKNSSSFKSRLGVRFFYFFLYQIPLLPALFLFVPVYASPSPFFSPTWAFRIDPPEGYELSGGNGKDRFSFRSSQGAGLDMVVYTGETYSSLEALVKDAAGRLKNRGEISYFNYRNKKAALIELEFPGDGQGEGPSGGSSGGSRRTLIRGWGFCVELAGEPAGDRTSPKGRPLLLALAYGPGDREDLMVLHLSALDSIAPTEADRYAPGPVTEFAYPRGAVKKTPLKGFALEALFYEHDAEAAQALVDREFAVLRIYAAGGQWREAWIRFYRAIYRDSFERLANAAFVLERHWAPSLRNAPSPAPGASDIKDRESGDKESRDRGKREFASKVLEWVQSFTYERNRLGSDFVNVVSAAAEGRGDCDSRALLWAIVLKHSNISSAMMVSREFNHAMGLADLAGSGARFETGGVNWLTAETTSRVPLGLIAKDMSEISKWLGIILE
jgi:hypothetical protein